jgi:hypothetical protein
MSVIAVKGKGEMEVPLITEKDLTSKWIRFNSFHDNALPN